MSSSSSSSSADLIARLFALTGTLPPTSRVPVTKVFAKCPRDRLVRAIAWYAQERQRNRYSLLEGVRALSSGWGDWYHVDAAPSGTSSLVRSITPERANDAIMMRPARFGSGWSKPAIAYVGEVRPSIELATTWLAAAAGCILHDDCAAHPALGAACSSRSACNRGLPHGTKSARLSCGDGGSFRKLVRIGTIFSKEVPSSRPICEVAFTIGVDELRNAAVLCGSGLAGSLSHHTNLEVLCARDNNDSDLDRGGDCGDSCDDDQPQRVHFRR